MPACKTSLTILFSAACSVAMAQNCSPPSDARKSELVEYVRKEYKLKPDTDLKLSGEELVPGACYRKMTFENKGPIKAWQITMYRSPDGRFLSGELFDTTIDPAQEQRRQAAALMAGLVPNKASSKGPDNAPVTIVEFSDFECPFCRRFADLVEQVLPAEKDEVRIVFHHLPLSIHPWARTAAEGAACAQLQNSDAFWSMHDQIFRHQQEITPSNVKEKLIEYAQKSQSLDAKSFQACLDNEMSLGLIFRDTNLATANDINATPTFFVNGHRASGVKDAAELQQLIAEAENETNQPVTSIARH